MNNKNILLTVALILVLLAVVVLILYWDVLFVPYTPSIDQLHKKHCTELNDVLDQIGVPKDSPYRSECDGEINSCPLTLRPSPGPDGSDICPGDSKKSKTKKGDDCCLLPPPMEVDEESTLTQAEHFAKDNVIIVTLLTKDLMNGFMDYLTKRGVSNPKTFLSGKLNILRQKLGDIAKGAGDAATKQASEEAIKQAGEEAAKKAAEEGGDESAQKAAREAAEKSAREAAQKAAQQTGTEAGGEAAERAGGELLTEIVTRTSVEIAAGCAAEISAKLALLLMDAASGVGAVLDVLMMGGMVMDFMDVGAYRQFMDNQYTYAHMRNSVEGATIVAMKQAGLNIPSYFNLLNLGNKVIGIQNYNDGDGLIFNKIYSCYKEASMVHQTNIMRESLNKLHSDDKILIDLFAQIFDENQKTPDISEVIKKKFKDLFHDNAVDRDKFYYNYMKNHLFYLNPEYEKYVMVDYDMSDADVYGITLSEEGIKKWNQFVIDTHHAPVVGRVIYSMYYRDIPDITDPKYVRDGQEKDPSTLNSEGDLRGTKVYNLVTMKIKDKKGVEKKWTQISAAANVIKTKCERGMHLPSMAYLLSNLADEKVCKWTQDPKCEGTADKDGNPCTLNKNQSNCANINDDGSPTGDCVFSGWIPSQCIINGYPSDEYAMNKLECQMNNGTYYASQCGTRKSSYIDAHTSNYSLAILQKTTCSEGISDPNCKEFATEAISTGVAVAAAPAIAAGFEGVKILGDTDVKPEEEGVTYDEDTGVCKMTKQWCKRMGLDYFEKKGHEGLVHPDQTFTNCTESNLQRDLEMILGKNMVRYFRLRMDEVKDCTLGLLLPGDHGAQCKGDFLREWNILKNFIQNEIDDIGQIGEDLAHDVKVVVEDIGDAFVHAWKSITSIF